MQQRLGSIDTLFRGDVEIIVAKALEKEKTRRYRSAEDLASDIRRYLRGEVILARKVNTADRYWRWARRHPAIAVLGSILTGVLVLTTASAYWRRLYYTQAVTRTRGYADTLKRPSDWRPDRTCRRTSKLRPAARPMKPMPA